MTENMRLQVQASKKRFPKKNQRSYLIDKVHISWDLKISRAATSPN